MWQKEPTKCVLSCNGSTVFERQVVSNVGDDGRIFCEVSAVSLADVNKQQLDPDVVNPTSIIESGDFISPTTLDYISPTDPAMFDADTLAGEFEKAIDESSKTE